jgi:hypothetical protein
MDALIVIVIFVLVVGFLAVVGHVIWLVVAAILKAMFGTFARAPQPSGFRQRRRRCPGCRYRLAAIDCYCPECHLFLDSTLAARLDRVRDAEREVLALADRGDLDAAIAQQVAARLDQRAQLLLKGEDGPPTAKPQTTPATERIEPVSLAALTLAEPFVGLGSPGKTAPAATPSLVAPTVVEPPQIPEPAVEERSQQRPGLLAGFMEERNILWGELIGGLLIVGCSIALVLTLWRSLEALPYFPFLLATGITAALYGAGQYTLHHWKLTATSRGLLVISLLLTPLNLLLLAGPGSGSATGGLDGAIKAAAVLLFVGLVRGAGRDLIGTHLLPGPIDRRWLLALAVVGAPASQILMAGWNHGPLVPSWLALSSNMIACGAVLGGLTWYRSRTERGVLTRQQGTALLTFVGISLIALFAAWGLVLTRSPDLSASVAGLAFPLALAAIPVVEAGILVQRRPPGDAGLKATGVAVALAGAMLLAVGATLAWPDAGRLLLVSLLAGAFLSRVSWRDGLPWLQIGAIPALGLAAVLMSQGVVGHWAVPLDALPGSWLREALGSSMSGVVLAVFGLMLATLAEACVRIGDRAQAVAYALGGAAAGIVSLYFVTIHGIEQPWPAVAVHALGICGLLAANVRCRLRIVAETGCWLILVGSLWCLWALMPDQRAAWGFVIALESLVLSAGALALTLRAKLVFSPPFEGGAGGVEAIYPPNPPFERGGEEIMFGQLRFALADVAAAAGVTAVFLTLFSPGFPYGWTAPAAFLVLALAGLLLARLFDRPGPMWAGSTSALVGLVLLTTFVSDVRPIGAALLLAILAHSTLALGGAWLLAGTGRGHLLGEPLRHSARITSLLAVLFLFFPAAGLAPVWATFAVWLALTWLALSWLWRETGAFSGAQGALTAAALLCGLSWVERQSWWEPTTILGPRALQALGISLALLNLAWILVRWAAVRNERLKALWLCDPFSVDRIVAGFVVVAQLALLAVAIAPAVRAELTPSVRTIHPRFAPELAAAFGPGAWLLLSLLGVGLVTRLRFSTNDEPSGDGPILGLAVLLVSLALAWAGGFHTEVATASAVRWGLAVAFLAGSTALFFREPLGRLAAGAGFQLRATLLSTRGSYVLFAIAATFVGLLTANLTMLGANLIKPSGPAEGSVFASMGYTASFIVPLGLLIVGLTGSAVRERSVGYAFAASMVWTATVASGYALMVILGGGAVDDVFVFRLDMLAVGSMAAWSLLWLAVERRVPGGALLDAQSAFGLIGLGLMTVAPLEQLFNLAFPLPLAYAEIGRYGWIALALAGWAGFERASRSRPAMCEHVVGFVSFVAGVLAACAVQPWDEPGVCASYLTMAATWAAAWLALTAASFVAPIVARGRWLVVLALAIALTALIGPVPRAGQWPIPLALAVVGLCAAGIVTVLARRALDAGPAIWIRAVGAQVLMGATALGLAVWSALQAPHLLERLAGPLAVLIVAIGLGLLVASAPAAWAGRLRVGAIAVAGGGIALVGWALPGQDEPVVWLQRNAWAFVAVVGAGVACPHVVPRLRPGAGWAADARRVAGGLGLIALAGLVFVLVQQALVFNPVTKRTPLPLPAVHSVLGGIAVMIGYALRAAVNRAADPLDLPDSRRTAYVYLAEALLVLFFIHVRFNLPELFLGQAVRYWTFIVMLLAFVGIGLAELFERRNVLVLAGPLRRTGCLLPLIPLLAFWAKPPAFVLEFADGQAPGLRPLLGYLEKLPQHFDSYAGLWFLAGLLYGLMALSRRSFGWALLGALATNAGIWALLAHTGVSAAVHPQVWVIPLALIVLVSEHINRRELRPETSAGLRYLGIGMLYLSSSADMFIAGVGESLWLPVILAGLCVAGVIGGIVLRVRAFMFLGTGFLLLDVFAMIWHAAVDHQQTWVWYASGIVLGATILALFALFEKRRNDLLAVVERLRQWD